MKKTNKIIMSMLSMLLVIGLVSHTAYASSYFLDVDRGVYYAQPINYLAENGLINGYEDGTFRPKKNISRAEAVQIIVHAFHLNGSGKQSTFTDTKNHWAEKSGAIGIAQERGIISGDGSGTFRPNDTITRAEVAQIIVTAANVKPVASFTSSFKDINQVPWAERAITILHAHGLVSGKEGNYFDPKGRTIRGDFSTMVYNVLMLDKSDEMHPEFNQNELSRIKNIKDKWQSLKPKANGSPLEIMPSVTAPYTPGKVHNAALQDALNLTNFFRYLSYLPSNVVLNKQFNEDAQTAALVNAVNQSMSHYPVQPKGMANKLYKQGYDAAGASNIGYGYRTIADGIQNGYMPDDSNSNRETVGHRRWILSPRLQEVGFGYAEASNGVAHTAMKVVAPNMWNNPEAPYRSILWPSETVFPVDFFGQQDPWSISLNAANYDATKTKDISVTLTRMNDQRKWHFSKQGETNDGYFKIDTENYGNTPFTLIFQPKQTANYQSGERYLVEVSGLYTNSGQRTTFQFETVFFEMNNY